MAKIGKSFASPFFVYRLDLMVNESRQCVNQMNIERRMEIRNPNYEIRKAIVVMFPLRYR